MNNNKQRLFEMMHKVGGMPLNENYQQHDEYYSNRIDDLLNMLINKKKDNDIYLKGVDSIIEKYGINFWENELSVFRKQLMKWMNDDNAHPSLPKFAIDEYEHAVDKFYQNKNYDMNENREEIARQLGIDPSELEDSAHLGDMADELSRQNDEYEYILDEVKDLFNWYNENIENIGKYLNPTLGNEFEYDRIKTIRNKILNSYPKFEEEMGYLEYIDTKEFNNALDDKIKNYINKISK
ncbi:MAG TPA: hypothetical protein PLN85_01110 [archaeon]|nr:hypothetical protein [archaeon]